MVRDAPASLDAKASVLESQAAGGQRVGPRASRSAAHALPAPQAAPPAPSGLHHVALLDLDSLPDALPAMLGSRCVEVWAFCSARYDGAAPPGVPMDRGCTAGKCEAPLLLAHALWSATVHQRLRGRTVFVVSADPAAAVVCDVTMRYYSQDDRLAPSELALLTSMPMVLERVQWLRAVR